MTRVIDEETYLAMHSASRQAIGDSALHKNLPQGRPRKVILDRQAKLDRELIAKRARLREEYYRKVKNGEIRPRTRIEKMIDTAKGQPDNPAVQAARRLLIKYGIN